MYSLGNESQLEGNYCLICTSDSLRTEQSYNSPSRFSFCVITKHINMADNSVGTPKLNLHKISTGQFVKTLLSYNPVLLETEISFLSIR